METISNKNGNRQPEKVCKNGCGKIIKWDLSQNAYIEVDTNNRHRCPNWNPNQKQLSTNVSHKITQEQQLYVDTIAPVLLEIHSAVLENCYVVKNIERFLSQLLGTESIRKRRTEQ